MTEMFIAIMIQNSSRVGGIVAVAWGFARRRWCFGVVAPRWRGCYAHCSELLLGLALALLVGPLLRRPLCRSLVQRVNLTFASFYALFVAHPPVLSTELPEDLHTERLATLRDLSGEDFCPHEEGKGW